MSVLIVGSMAVDTVEFTGTGEKRELVGGSATFASLSAGLYADVRMVGVVGRDFPASTLEALRGRGVDLAGVQVVDGETFRWHGRYAPDLSTRESISTHLNVFERFNPVLPASYRDSRVVLLGNIHPTLQGVVLDQTPQASLIAADTMNFWIHGTPKELLAVLARVNLLIINEEEARDLAGQRSIARVGRELQKLGPRRVVVKQGEYGAWLFDGDEIFHAPAYPVEQVVDPTGAGDTFAGAMLGYLDAEGELTAGAFRRAVVHGSAVASLCVEHYGTEGVLNATRDRIDARVRAFARLVHAEHD
ncbi:MAG: PfkB family carbohydrate kinase [Polyangiales bacterium]